VVYQTEAELDVRNLLVFRSIHCETGRVTQQKTMFQAVDAANDDSFTGPDWGLFVSVSLIWGASFLLIAEALEGLTPGTVTLGRVGVGAITLFVIRAIRGGGKSIEREDYGSVFLLSLLWVAVPFTLFPLAQEHINSAVTGLLNGATPVFAGLVSALLVKVAPRGVQLAGIAAGFFGIILISLGSSGGGSTELRGVLMVLAATACYGFAVNLASPLQAKYGPINIMTVMLGLATLWVLPFGLFTIGENEWSVGPIAAVLFLGAVGTGLAYWIMAALVGRVGGIRASFITYLIPVVSLTLGVLIRDDTVRALAIVGAIITIGGAAMASRAKATS